VLRCYPHKPQCDGRIIFVILTRQHPQSNDRQHNGALPPGR